MSENIGDHFADFGRRMAGQALAEFFGAAAVHSLRNQLALMRNPGGNVRLFSLYFAGVPKPFDVAMHMQDGTVVLEALPASHADPGDPVGTVRELAAKLHCHDRLPDLMKQAAHQFRALTGYDRVTLFGSDGELLAHDARGNHPPANAPLPPVETRMISDAGAASAAIEPPADPGLLDKALLRPPIEAERAAIRADGATACLTLPLRSGSRNLGSAVCLNQSPRRPMLDRLVAAELLADIIAMRMEICELRSRQA